MGLLFKQLVLWAGGVIANLVKEKKILFRTFT
jgi:hypothetical protein